MGRALPRWRFAGLALPLLLAGCMAGVLPGADAPDPSCVLLCALTREIGGAVAPQSLPMAAAATTKPVGRRPVARARTRPARPQAVAAAPAPRRRIALKAHLRPVHPKPVADVSVVPQAPAQAPEPKPVAVLPSVPAPIAAPVIAPARSLSAAIPGSAGIMMPAWVEP